MFTVAETEGSTASAVSLTPLGGCTSTRGKADTAQEAALLVDKCLFFFLLLFRAVESWLLAT